MKKVIFCELLTSVPTDNINFEVNPPNQQIYYEEDVYDPVEYEVKLIKKQLENIELQKIKHSGKDILLY
jgi:hypothetical protein